MEKNTRHSTFIKYINYPFSNLYFFVKPYTSNAHALGPGPNNSTGDPYYIVVLFEKEIVIPDLHNSKYVVQRSTYHPEWYRKIFDGGGLVKDEGDHHHSIADHIGLQNSKKYSSLIASVPILTQKSQFD